MAIMPTTANETINYLNEDKRNELRAGMENFFQLANLNYNNELSLVSVDFQDRDAFIRNDEDGYENSESKPMARYCPDREIICVCADNLSKFVNDFRRDLCINNSLQFISSAFLLCDLVLLHEFMHGYQHLVEHKNLTHGNRVLEEEVNRRAAIILTYTCENNEDFIKKAITFYEGKSEFGFGDGISLDELVINRNDIEYLVNIFP